MRIDINKGLSDIDGKTDEEVQYDSAVGWAEKCCAAYKKSTESDDLAEKIRFLLWAESLRDEAIEHAGKCEDHGSFLSELQDDIDEYRHSAMKSFQL
jgi:hypothetical protein